MKKLLVVIVFVPLVSLGQMDYYVSANGGLNVREAPEAKAKKVSTLSYGTFVLIESRTAIKLTINDTDKRTGVNKQIEGEWVEIVSENNIAGYVFDGFLTKVKTDSFDYLKFIETENRVLYSDLEEGQEYLYKGQKYTGLAISFYDNGQLAFAASYKDGKLNGWWRKWEENGSLFLETEYLDGEMVSEIDFN